MPPIPVEIPPGWEQRLTEDGRICFLNVNTKTTTWCDPRGVYFSGEPCGHLPSGWECRQTSTGKVYYLDHITKTTTWVDPRRWESRTTDDGRVYFIDHVKNVSEWQKRNDGSAEWEQHIMDDGQAYYVNTTTEERSLTDPCSGLQSAIDGNTPTVDGAPLETEWFDGSTRWELRFAAGGRPYYVNHTKKTTIWKDPRITTPSGQIDTENEMSHSKTLSSPESVTGAPEQASMLSSLLQEGHGSLVSFGKDIPPSSQRLDRMYGASRPQSKSTPSLRERIACQSCKASPIEGVRFMCPDCDNFNLCETCKDKGEVVHNPTHHLRAVSKESRTIVHDFPEIDASPSPSAQGPLQQLFTGTKDVQEVGTVAQDRELEPGHSSITLNSIAEGITKLADTKSDESGDSIQNSLFAQYGKIWDEIQSLDANSARLAEKTLSWVLHAKRPMNLSELREAIVIDEGMKQLLELPDIHSIIETCKDLLHYDSVSEALSLSNQYARKFIEKRCSLTEVDIAKLCLTYLLSDILADKPCDNDDDIQRRLEVHPFASYSSLFWAHHVKCAGERNPQIQSLLLTLFDSPSKIDLITELSSDSKVKRRHFGKTWLHVIAENDLIHTWTSILGSSARTQDWVPIASEVRAEDGSPYRFDVATEFGWTAAHFAAYKGHTRILAKLIDVNAHVLLPTKTGLKPFHLAAFNGHHDVVNLLLQANHDPSVKDEAGWTPLHFAAMNGHLNTVDILLRTRADVQIMNKYDPDEFWRFPTFYLAVRGLTWDPKLVNYIFNDTRDPEARDHTNWSDPCIWTPLQLAAKNGHREIVDLLSKRDPNTISLQDVCGWTPLHGATFNGQHGIVEQLLQAGADVSIQDNARHCTALMYATMRGHIDIVEILLKANADVSPADKEDQWTALHWAAELNHQHIAALLLAAGSDVSATDKQNRTPVHLAAGKGHCNIVSLLLSSNPDLSIQDENGRTALHFATEEGHSEVVLLLLNAGADPSIQTCRRRTPLHWASMKGFTAIAHLLMKVNAVISMPDENLSTPLHYAAANGHRDIVDLLIKANADVLALDIKGRTAIYRAASFGRTEVVAMLLEAGADPTLNKKGRTVLHGAAKHGHSDVVELLLTHSIDVSAGDQSGLNALHLASMNGHVKVVEMLIEAGCDIHSTDECGWTPLHFASRRGEEHVMAYLVRSNADLSILDHVGRSALHYAAQGGHKGTIDMLIQAGADIARQDLDGYTALHVAASKGHVSAVDSLLRAGADINAMLTGDNSGHTPLIFATLNGHVSVVERLLSDNADTSIATSYNGFTPLHCATGNGYDRIVDLLLKANADPSKRANGGETPLHYASNAKVVRLLLNANDDLQTMDKDGWTPLHFAAYFGKNNVLEALLQAPSAATALNKTENKGWSALQHAARNGHLDAVRTLIDAGADFNSETLSGHKAVHFAEDGRHYEILFILLKLAGCNIDDSTELNPSSTETKNEKCELSTKMLYQIVRSLPQDRYFKNKLVERLVKERELEKALELLDTLLDLHPPNAQARNISSIIHRANCNKCGKQIAGFKFKCTECKDKDLCNQCALVDTEDHQLLVTPSAAWISAHRYLVQPQSAAGLVPLYAAQVDTSNQDIELSTLSQRLVLKAIWMPVQFREWAALQENKALIQSSPICVSISLCDPHHCQDASCKCSSCGKCFYITPDPVVFMSCGHIVHDECITPGPLFWCKICSHPLANVDNYFQSLVTRKVDMKTIENSLTEFTSKTKTNDVVVLMFLMMKLQDRIKNTQSADDLNLMMNMDEILTKRVPVAAGVKNLFQGGLAAWLHARFDSIGSMDDLDAAIETAKKAIEGPVSDYNRALFLQTLGTSLRQRFEQTQSMDDLNAAVNAFEEAVTLTPQLDLTRSSNLYNLGSTLHLRFQQTESMVDLNAAIAAIEDILKLPEDDDSNRLNTLQTLAILLQLRFEKTRSMGDLNAAVEANQKATKFIPDNPAALASQLSRLANSLLRRFEEVGALENLHTAVEALENAVQLVPTDSRRALYLSMLGVALRIRYIRTESLDDLKQSFQIATEALELTPEGHSSRASYVEELDRVSHLLRIMSKESLDASDFDQAVEFCEESLKQTSQDSPERASALHSLGMAFFKRFELGLSTQDLEKTIELIQSSLGMTHVDSPKRAAWLVNLAEAFEYRFSVTGSIDDLSVATEAYFNAISSKHSQSSARINAARRAARLYTLIGDSDTLTRIASKLLDDAIQILPSVSPLSLHRLDQQYALANPDISGLAADACALSIRANKIGGNWYIFGSLWLLEFGRGFIAGSYLDRRTDLAELEDVHPILANKFKLLRDELEQDHGNFEPLVSIRRQKASEEFEGITRLIREENGFEDFLLRPSDDNIKNLAVHGPIVFLNASQYGCDSFLVTRDNIRHFSLPLLRYEDLIQKADELSKALAKISITTRREANASMKNVLEWLWDVTVGPILEELGFRETPRKKDAWPHIWWVPAGRLTLFPIHAAGYHLSDNRRTALDRVISSYIPTVKALAHARAQIEKIPNCSTQTVLMASMPTTPDRSDLPFAEEEVTAISDILPESMTKIVLRCPTKAHVLLNLQQCTIAHFACHGEVDSDDPSRSKILLSDHQQNAFSVVDMAGVQLDRAQLAYISGCHSANNQNIALLDEAIHMAGACQLAGFPTVIGTLWQIKDKSSVTIAKFVYNAMMRNDGLLDTRLAASGLHFAIRELRDQSSSVAKGLRRLDYMTWAPYIHVGV